MSQAPITLAEVRLALFQLLQAAYAAPATPELAGALAEVAAAYGEALGCALPQLAPLEPGPDLAEFHRLFVGPERLVAPPYESVYVSPEPALMQEATFAVRSFYRRHGLTLGPERNEPDDHIAFELEFYARLQAGALAGAGEDLTEPQRRFLTEHLARWVPAFCGRIAEGSRSPFYRSLAALTRAVIQLDAEHLNPAAHAKEESTA
ncbi:TorD/DmsD family molecular chaperone [Symbiobacterium terraclitae]|uniref:TorD/DmsD family molecular chaperone n=1 Tax=Symbiobacterium terraclitae TaxID=557451 RepID=UPI0035B50D5F